MMFRDRLEQMISEADARDGADSKAALLSMLRELANGIDTVAVRTGLFSISAVPASEQSVEPKPGDVVLLTGQTNTPDGVYVVPPDAPPL